MADALRQQIEAALQQYERRRPIEAALRAYEAKFTTPPTAEPLPTPTPTPTPGPTAPPTPPAVNPEVLAMQRAEERRRAGLPSTTDVPELVAPGHEPAAPQASVLPAPYMQAAVEGAGMGAATGGVRAILPTALDMVLGTKAVEVAQPAIEAIPGEGWPSTVAKVGAGMAVMGVPGMLRIGIQNALRAKFGPEAVPPEAPPSTAPPPARELPVETVPFEAAPPQQLAPEPLPPEPGIPPRPAPSGLPVRPPGFEARPPEAPAVAPPVPPQPVAVRGPVGEGGGAGGVTRLPSGDYVIEGRSTALTFRTPALAQEAAQLPEAEAWTLHHRQFANYPEGPAEPIIRAKLVSNQPLTAEEQQFVAIRRGPVGEGVTAPPEAPRMPQAAPAAPAAAAVAPPPAAPPVAVPGPVEGAPVAPPVEAAAPSIASILKSETGAAIVPGAETAKQAGEAVRATGRNVARLVDPIGFASDETLNTLVGRKGADIEAARFQYNQLSQGNEALFDRLIGRQGQSAAYDYLSRLSTGRRQLTPELQRVADLHRQVLDASALGVAEVRGDFPYLEHYVPGIWKDPANAERVLMSRGRRPLEGSKNFLRKKFYRDFADGIAAGLTPVTDNPETLIRTYLEDVRKYVWAQHIRQDGVAASRWQWVAGEHGELPEGKAWLDDPIARKYFPPDRVPLIIPAENLRETLAKFATILRTERVTEGSGRTTRTTTTTGGTTAEPASTGKIEERVREALSARGFASGEVDQYIARLKTAGAGAAPEGAAEAQTTIIKEITEKVRTILRTQATELHLPEEVRTLGRTAMGPTLAGRWAIDEGEARLLKNYLSRNVILEDPTVRGAIRANSLLNGLQLGMSGFHALGETFNSWASHAGLAMGRAVRGDWRGAARAALETPAAPILYIRKAAKLWNDPALVEMALSPFQSGAQLAPPTGAFHTGSVWEAFRANLRRGEYGGALTKAPAAAIDGMMKPLFEYVIPRMKVGAYLDLLGDELARNADAIAAGQIARETVARDAWKNIENRFGKINYDNLFWNRTFQASQHLMWRAVGWNHGTIRELGGAALQDTPQALKGLVTGQGGQFTPKMQYLLGLTFSVASAGALYQYLHTGQPPQELTDYFFPKNGERDANGNEIRVRFPTYFKDIHALSDVKGTLVNKLSPVAHIAMSLWQNRDFFGDYVWNPNDVLPTKLKQVAQYLVAELQPFTFRQFGRLAEGQANLPKQLEAFAGITKAPQSVIETPLEAEMRVRQEELRGGRGPRTPQQRDLDRLKAKARTGLASGDIEPLRTWAQESERQGRPVTSQTITELLKSSRQTPTERQFEALPLYERLRLLQRHGKGVSP